MESVSAVSGRVVDLRLVSGTGWSGPAWYVCMVFGPPSAAFMFLTYVYLCWYAGQFWGTEGLGVFPLSFKMMGVVFCRSDRCGTISCPDCHHL